MGGSAHKQPGIHSDSGAYVLVPAISLIPELPAVLRLLAELLFDAQQLIVFCDAIGARGRAGLNLTAVGGDGDVGDGRVFGFARAMGEDGAVAVAHGKVDRGEGLAERAD